MRKQRILRCSSSFYFCSRMLARPAAGVNVSPGFRRFTKLEPPNWWVELYA